MEQVAMQHAFGAKQHRDIHGREPSQPLAT